MEKSLHVLSRKLFQTTGLKCNSVQVTALYNVLGLAGNVLTKIV